jgi:DNA-binding CsgD family transcriptional regulator
LPVESRAGSRAHLAENDVARLDRQCASIVGLLDGDEILLRIAKLLTDEYGFHLSWIAEPAADGARIRHTSGNRTNHFRGILRNGLGLGGKVFESGRLQWVDDYFASAEITHEYDEQVAAEQVRRMVAAPIIAGGRNFGVLLGGHRDQGSSGDRSAAIIEAVAERCARALSIARSARAAAEAAANDERRRTALQLHDRVGDMLCSITANARALGDHPTADDILKQRLHTIERQAGDATASLREWVHSLAASSERPDLMSAHEATCRVCDARAAEIRRRRDRHSPIAKREYDVLLRVATGETNYEIASAMSLSCNTVKTYLRNAMAKLGARNRVEAIARAREIGLL